MAVTVAEKAKVIAENQRAKGDTGSPEVQVALLTARINGLNDHFKANVTDQQPRRGFMRMGSRARTRDGLRAGGCRMGGRSPPARRPGHLPGHFAPSLPIPRAEPPMDPTSA